MNSRDRHRLKVLERQSDLIKDRIKLINVDSIKILHYLKEQLANVENLIKECKNNGKK